MINVHITEFNKKSIFERLTKILPDKEVTVILKK